MQEFDLTITKVGPTDSSLGSSNDKRFGIHSLPGADTYVIVFSKSPGSNVQVAKKQNNGDRTDLNELVATHNEILCSISDGGTGFIVIYQFYSSGVDNLKFRRWITPENPQAEK